jgi:hypothetical protein
MRTLFSRTWRRIVLVSRISTPEHNPFLGQGSFTAQARVLRRNEESRRRAGGAPLRMQPALDEYWRRRDELHIPAPVTNMEIRTEAWQIGKHPTCATLSSRLLREAVKRAIKEGKSIPKRHTSSKLTRT